MPATPRRLHEGHVSFPLHPSSYFINSVWEREEQSVMDQMARMKRGSALLLLLLVIFSVPMAMGYDEEEEGREGDRGGRGGREEREDMFILHHSRKVVRTEAGEMRVLRGFRGKGMEKTVHIGFINMEPKTLFLPQYIDSNLIIFVRRGEMKIGWINKHELVERQLKMGDIYRIPAGSTFYVLNTGERQRLQIICSIDKFEKIGREHYKFDTIGQELFQSFFIGGGRNPPSVLSGFDYRTLKTAFNISSSELEDITTRQKGGPIVYVPKAQQPDRWASFMQLKQRERLGGLMGMEGEEEDEESAQESKEEEHEGAWKWTWRKLLQSVMGKQKNQERRSTEPYNLYDKKPDFQNSYGWSVSVDKHDYPPLKRSNVGVYLVNLTAGSMMAPHVNPRATEYGIVLRGRGSVQVVFPNGSLGMNAKVQEGDVFVVPKYFPFCQIASRSGPMEFFGFTTSAATSRPQFLVGSNSILQAMMGPELAAAFDMSEERLEGLIEAQRESVILPAVLAFPPEADEEEEEEKEEEQKQKAYVPNGRIGSIIRSLEADMVMGFD